jgi:hypothetical protein
MGTELAGLALLAWASSVLARVLGGILLLAGLALWAPIGEIIYREKRRSGQRGE